MTTVAALYVDPRGPYPGLLCEHWDATRDARLYDGPHPVVAHPPCGPWSKLRHLYRGAEHDCAPRAVEQVRKWGGVLEHPAGSKLWGSELPGAVADLPLPGAPPDAWGGYTIQVDQVEWGHVARKSTWVYLVGVPREKIPSPPFPGRQPTHWCSGRRTPFMGATKGPKPGVAPPGMKFCSAQQRRRTPRPFAEWLLGLAAVAERP